MEYIMWIFWYGFITLFILTTIVMGCCVIGAITYGMCSLMTHLNKKLN